MKRPKVTALYFATSPDGKVQARGKTEKEALKLLEETINAQAETKKSG